MRKIKFLTLILGVLVWFCGQNSCTEEGLDLSDVNTDSLYLQTALDVPVAQVNASLKEIVKHNKSKGVIYTPDTTLIVRGDINTKIKFPIAIKEGTYIEERDSFTNLFFNNKVGDGHAIDKVETCILKVEVDNSLPMRIDYKLTFLHRDTTTNTLVEISELSQEDSFSAAPGTYNETNKTISGSTITKHSITYNKSHMGPLSQLDQINVEYKFVMENFEQTILTEKNTMKMKIACFFKGGILANEYDF